MSLENKSSPYEFDPELMPVMALQSVILLLLAVIGGVFLAVVALPSLLPNLSNSLFGSEPKVFWYLSRSSALVAYGILWFSMAFGLLVSNKMARVWPGGPTAVDLHQYTSLLGLVFALFHALILMGDKYIAYSLSEVLIPFASKNYHPFWVGIGQIGFYVWVIVAFSFYFRKMIGARAWRKLHFFSFIAYLMALFHAFSSGTDSNVLWVASYYWWTGGIFIFLLIYRILVSIRLFSGSGEKTAQVKKA
ncbi:MAG: ferric reductase-like transmembrane domain-containing protein [Anaerolineae bacterium]|nr:ferric reductase-like transmembrane domain-containing protein [Anaerolineae bacterium]